MTAREFPGLLRCPFRRPSIRPDLTQKSGLTPARAGNIQLGASADRRRRTQAGAGVGVGAPGRALRRGRSRHWGRGFLPRQCRTARYGRAGPHAARPQRAGDPADPAAASDRFTADASHELRTPLAVIRGIGEMGLRETRDASGVQGCDRQHARRGRSSDPAGRHALAPVAWRRRYGSSFARDPRPRRSRARRRGIARDPRGGTAAAAPDWASRLPDGRSRPTGV